MSGKRIAVIALLLALAAPAAAQTRAWLDRAQVTYGETATLNIETTAPVQQLDYRPLAAQFDLSGQTVRRSFERIGGQSRTRSLFAVGLRPRGPGVLTVPALQVGSARTAPLRLTVLPPSVLPASGDADVFVETVVDAGRPYVQQAVGIVVRLHYAVPLLSGQLDQDAPASASLRRVGEDLQYQREIDGRRYTVVERRFLLVPERSGALVLPGARFNGQGVSGFFDNLFGDGRKPLSAAAPNRRLQVLPLPADAPQPWLPLHDLRLRYLQLPARARVGEATTIEIEAIADGAQSGQVPPIVIADNDAAQVFAEPAQSDELFVDGRPRTTVRRRIAIVPLQPGVVVLDGPRIDWWDAAQGVARTAMLPPLRLQVAPGAGTDTTGAGLPEALEGVESGQDVDPRPAWSWLAVVSIALLALLALVAWRARGRGATGKPRRIAQPEPRTPPPASLRDALATGDLAGIALALAREAGTDGDLDAVQARLDEPAQREAVARLQAARWGADDGAGVLPVLRAAFARGARWRVAAPAASPLLPPLYPQR